MEDPLNLTGRNLVNLGIQACHLVDLPDNRVDCSNNTNECIGCPSLGRFASGDHLNDTTSMGHVICLILWLVIFTVGTLGTIGNILIILILRRQKKSEKGFNTFLMGLASFDILCSIASVISSTGATFYFQNWSRGTATVYAFCGGILAALWGRSGSSFMTVLITVERYLVVAFPIKFGSWFTVKRARFLVFGVFIWSLIMAIPRFTSSYIGENNVWRDIQSVQDTEIIIFSTPLEKFWFHDMYGFFDQIDFWGPLPILLIFNGLIYFHVLKFELRRRELNMKHRRDIRAAKMFLPVIFVLFLCNIEPIVHYYLVGFKGFLYRELYSGMLLSFAVNSAVNLPIYYLKGSSFRHEARALISTYFPNLHLDYTQGDSSTVAKGGKSGGTASTDSNEKYNL